ncbi:MAG: hypothetical protein ABSD38_36535 [Syntrophorhabdales bacterium]
MVIRVSGADTEHAGVGAGVPGARVVVVAEGAVKAESDNAQLVPMLEEVQANLGAVAQETVADGGYSSGQQWEEAEARGYDVLVAPGVETGGPKRGEWEMCAPSGRCCAPRST